MTILSHPDIDMMPRDNPVKDERDGSRYVLTFVRNAEVSTKVRHGLGNKPSIIQLCWSDVPVIFQEDTTRWAHMLFDVSSSAVLYIYNFEGGSFSGGDTTVPINNNRNSANTSILTVAANPTTYTIGATYLDSACIGNAVGPGAQTDIGGGSGRDDELILKQDSVYFWYFVSGAADNVVNYKGLWYEHINKD